jgi:hypothetical protein
MEINKLVLGVAACAMSSVALAQVVLPEGTKVRVRLEQTLSSATAEEGQPVQLSVTEDVKAGESVVIAQGAGCVGSITQAVPKRRMGRTGKLDFSIERCAAVDGNPVPLRYTVNKKEGGSHAGRTGALTAGAAIVFWPAAPVFLLMKGKDVTVNKGIVIDVFTDQRYVTKPAAQVSAAPTPNGAPAPAAASAPQQSASVRITSEPDGAEIELNGAFIGSTPATLQLPAGAQNLVVRKGALIWRRTMQVQAGSTVSVNAVLAK